MLFIVTCYFFVAERSVESFSILADTLPMVLLLVMLANMGDVIAFFRKRWLLMFIAAILISAICIVSYIYVGMYDKRTTVLFILHLSWALIPMAASLYYGVKKPKQ